MHGFKVVEEGQVECGINILYGASSRVSESIPLLDFNLVCV
jgi:hypothetical protein